MSRKTLIMKRFISMIVALIMLISVYPSAMAETTQRVLKIGDYVQLGQIPKSENGF